MFRQNKYTKWYFSIIDARKITPYKGYIEKHHIVPSSLGGLNNKDNIVCLSAREHYIVHWLLVKMVILSSHKRSMQFAFWQMSRGGNIHQQRKITSAQYQIARKHVAEANRSLNIGRKIKYSEEGLLKKQQVGKQNGLANKGLKHSEETKLKKSYAKRGANNHFFGKKHTEESKIKMSISQKARPPKSDETIIKMKETARMRSEQGLHHFLGKCGSEAIFFGKKHTEEALVKMRQPKSEETKARMRKPKGPQQKLTCPHCQKEGGASNMKKYHFENCKFLSKENARTP